MKEMTLDNLHMIAESILDKARSSSVGTATVITLSGDLGSGKTTLTQEIALIFGIKEYVVSPTFVIMKKYDITDGKFKHLIHIDAYRLNKSKELFKLGWEEILSDPGNLVIIEWPEQVPECIPEKAICIKLAHGKEHTRTIEFDD